MKRPLPAQRGMTLIMALVLLILITLLALTSFNLGKSNLQIVNNMQTREVNLAAAQEVIEETISNTRFFNTPADALGSPCNNQANTRCIDTNGDGTPDVTVVLSPPPTCVKAQSIKNSDLNPINPEDAGCMVSAAQSFGVAGSVTGDSLCSDSVWEIHALATDNVTAAKTEIMQGVSVRVAKDDISTNCP